MKNKRSLYIAILLLLGVSLTIGYAVLSQSLKINGRANIASNSWIIYFDHLVERPGSITPTTPTTINAAKDRIDFNILLKKPGDNYTYEVDIINDGTIDAMIDSVSLSGLPSSLEGIVEWKVNYLDGTPLRKCDELLAKTQRRIKVVVNYKRDINELPEATNMNLSLEVNYVQLDKTVCTTTNPRTPDPYDPNDGRHTLTVDPNYGIYEGSDEVLTFRMGPGEVYIFGADPTQEAHIFAGWDVINNETYDISANTITMGTEDIDATAQWTWETDNEIEGHPGICFSANMGTNNEYFPDFNSALNFINEEGTIKLLHNGCRISGDRIEIPEGKNITYDLNGHSGILSALIENKGEFTVTDSSKSQKGELHLIEEGSNFGRIYTLTGKPMSITGGKYYIENIRNIVIQAYNDASLLIENSEFYITQNNWSETIYTSPGATTTIKNNKFYANATKAASTGTVVYNQNDATITLEDNYFEVESKSWEYRVIHFAGEGTYTLKNNEIQGKGVLNGILNNGYINVDGLIINLEIEVDENTSTPRSNTAIQAIGASGDGEFNDVHITIKGDTDGHEVWGIMSTCQMLKNSSVDIEIARGKVYGMSGGTSTIEDTTFNIKTTVGEATQAIASYATVRNVDIKIENSSLTTYGINGNAKIYDSNIEIKMLNDGGAPVVGVMGASEVDNTTILIEEEGHYLPTGASLAENGTISNSSITIKGPNYGRPIVSVDPASAMGSDTTYEYIQTN